MAQEGGQRGKHRRIQIYEDKETFAYAKKSPGPGI